MLPQKMKTVTWSALCIIPPESVWSPIQAIRKIHDKSYKRWMPHINIFFPFLPPDQFDDASKKLEVALSKMKPFKITFKQFSKFDKNSYIWLYPETESQNTLQELYNACAQVFPECVNPTRRTFIPHLTVAQSRDKDKLIKQLQKDWKQLEFLCKEIYMISRCGKDEPFEVRKVIHLGGDTTKPNFKEVPVNK